MDIAGLLDDMKERVRTRGATPLVGGGLLGSFTRGLLGLDPSEEDGKFSKDLMLKAYQTGQALSNTPTPLALAVAPAAIAKAGKAAKGKKPLPREEALETARKNAVEMLGLPESNTAMDRARAMGFDVEAYHGTGLQPNFDDPSGLLLNPDFRTFIETADGIPARSALFVSTSPKVASGYAQRQEGQVLPVLIKSGKQSWSDAKGQHWKDYFGRHGVIEANARGSRSAGYDTYKIKNVIDPFDSKYVEVADTIAVLNPANIRSRFAAFDPKRINDPDLLASLAAFGVGIPAYGLLEED